MSIKLLSFKLILIALFPLLIKPLILKEKVVIVTLTSLCLEENKKKHSLFLFRRRGYLGEFLEALHRRTAMRMMDVQPSAPEANVLPEVIVTCYINSGGGFSSYNSINLGSLFGASYGGSSGYYSSGYYSSMDGIGGGGSGNGEHYGNSYDESYSNQEYPSHGLRHGDAVEDEPELVDFEFVENLSPIDISKYLQCFSNIPDNGATCSIEILVDIPVDYNPNRLFNFEQGSPGHTFLRITKTNRTQSVTQNIGFYPTGTWKTLLTQPVQNKIVDNGEHEFNASLKMNITPEQLNNSLNRLNNLASRDYDIDEYNCTDFALEIFNQSRIGNPIGIQKIDIPGGRAENGTQTPGELYKKLKSMQQSGIESGNINIPNTKAFIGGSNGPCN